MFNKKKIVTIIYDEIDVTKIFLEALRENIVGISFFSFTDPVDAVKYYIENSKNCTLVRSDLRMPCLNGLELLKKSKYFTS